MSHENVEIVRRAVSAFNRQDEAAWTQLMDPELETDPVAAWPEPGPLIGTDAAWAFYMEFQEVMVTDQSYEVSEAIDAGEMALVCVEVPVRGRESDAKVEFKLWTVATVRQGRIIRQQWFTDRNDALQAAGLRE